MEINQIYSILKRDCSYYIDLLSTCKKGHYLLRGYNYNVPTIKRFEHDLENRKPRNMPPHIHDQINNFFFKKFNWKIRNGIFCYGFDTISGAPIELGYGPFYLFFPIGVFEYVFSETHFDLFGSINFLKEDLDSFIKNLDFENSNFCKVMKTRPQFHNLGNEVSVKANSYYLVNLSTVNTLTEKIWL